MAFTESWVETDPDGSVITGSLLDDYQRQSKRAIRERLEGDPANPNSGIYESGTFGATSIVRAGTARAYAVTLASVAGLTLQDGRLAITTDTRQLFHLKATGAVEISYMAPGGDVSANVVFNTVSSLGFILSGNGSYAAGKFYKDAVNGVIIAGAAGSSYDVVLANSAGTGVLRIVTGTVNLTAAGYIAATSNIQGAYFQTNTANPAASGEFRIAANTGINWRNSTNTGDIAGIYTSGGVTHFGSEADYKYQFDRPGVGIGQAPIANYALNVFDANRTSTTVFNNTIARFASNASGADASIVFTDNVTYAAYISAKADVFTFRVAATNPASFDVNGINAINLTTADDQSKKLTIGRFSAGSPFSYIQIAPASSSGLAITNAGSTLNVLTLSNAGKLTITDQLVVAGSATACSAGQLSLGGNTSTTANTYGGGGVSALPAQPAGYLPIFIGATNFKVPYYVA